MRLDAVGGFILGFTVGEIIMLLALFWITR
jgi:hypothetical protein